MSQDSENINPLQKRSASTAYSQLDTEHPLEVQNMVPLKRIAALVYVFSETLISLTLSASILVIILKDRSRNTNLPLCDQIHIAMGLVNIVLQCAVSAHGAMYFIDSPILYVKEMFQTFFILLPFLVYFSFWLNAWLCVYYATSVSSFHHRFLVRLKSKFPAMLPKLMLVSAVGSFVISVPTMWNVYLEMPPESNGNMSTNATSGSKIIQINPLYQLSIASLGCFVPFTLSVLCIGHTLTSVLRHVWRVKHNECGVSRPSLQAHVRAAVTMILLLFLYLSFYLSQAFSFVCDYITEDVLSIVSWIFIDTFPAAESLIIIQASSRLRKAFHIKLFW
ncbi:taste receptor type 2 member 40-like [Spea bombifrons]|uniref:taste receptor type 2 member 40-like n=1 Tax=Spea bombifrons TaxID=233779 RepID=UPI00234AB1B4|nr:taste receptor type 2 member 40-like [Spea bombifrons]